jgi:tetratricopeptide (TPR) repeat protein
MTRSDNGLNASPFVNPVVLDTLSQLRGHSLILAEESSTTIRFRMLEMLREFATEQLMPDERSETERRHADFLHHWVTGAASSGPDRAAWLDRFEEDLDNLRAVLEWSLQDQNDLKTGLQLATSLFGLWQARGHLSEGRRWYARLLERADNTPTRELCRCFYGAGTLAYHQGDFQAARSLLERCIEVAQAIDDEGRICGAYEVWGNIAYRQGDYTEARTLYEKTLSLARRRGSALQVASALGNLANVAQSTGDFATSRALNEESLQIRREQEDQFGEGRTLHNLANLAHSQGHLEEARTYYEQAIALKRMLADHYSLVSSLIGIAGVAIDQGDYIAAVAYTRESLNLAREMEARMNLLDVAYMQTAILRGIGERRHAARIFGTLERLREEMGYPLPQVDQHEYDQIQTALRQALGDEDYEAAKAEGRNLSLEQALVCLEEILANNAL